MNGDRNDDKEETVNGKSNVENFQTEVVVLSTGKVVRWELNLPFFHIFRHCSSGMCSRMWLSCVSPGGGKTLPRKKQVQKCDQYR